MLATKTEDIKNIFKSKLLNEKFVIDRTGQKTIEIIVASFHADKAAIFGEPNQDYINRELLWYKSQITNVNAIEGKVPAA